MQRHLSILNPESFVLSEFQYKFTFTKLSLCAFVLCCPECIPKYQPTPLPLIKIKNFLDEEHVLFKLLVNLYFKTSQCTKSDTF